MTETYLKTADGCERLLRPGENFQLLPGQKLISRARKQPGRKCSGCGNYTVYESG